MEGNDDPGGGQQGISSDDRQTHGTGTPIRGTAFNWMFPLLGAVGFGIGFGAVCAFGATHFDIARNSFASAFPGTGVGPEGGIIRGGIAGAIGGGVLGLAAKDKKYCLSVSLAGAIGFGLAFVLAIALAPSIGYLLEHDLFAGAIVGGIGGAAMGLGSTRARIGASLLSGAAGAVWFACAFVVTAATFDGNMCSAWNALGGAVGGAVFGLTLAPYSNTSERAP
jgi:hypothetical protein